MIEIRLEAKNLSDLCSLEDMTIIVWQRHDNLHRRLYDQLANATLNRIVSEDMVDAAYNLAVAYQKNYFRLYASMHECECTPVSNACPTCVARIRMKSNQRESLELY